MAPAREKAKPEPTEREKKTATCPKCSAVFPPHHDTCAHCGYTRQRHNGVIVLPGEMEELNRRDRAARDERARFYSELVHIAEARGYKPGWSWHKFIEKFGVEPKGLRAQPVAAASFATLKWVQSRNIRYAKGRGAA
jgi:ribosomal protein S27AE